jgi:hypothetical protein
VSESDSLEDLGVGGNTILKWTLKYRMGARTGFDWLRIRIDVGLR